MEARRELHTVDGDEPGLRFLAQGFKDLGVCGFSD